MAKKDIVIHIKSALDAAGINATKSQVATMASEIAKANAAAAKKSSTSWTEFYSKWRTIAAGIKAAWEGVKAVLELPFRYETQTRQFKTLIGDIDEARKHMADLKALGDTPPFSLDQFAAASRQLMVMSDGALGFKGTMELVGDAAAATGVDLETMGHAVGRLYAFIRDGEPLNRAVMELRNMGVLTPAVCQQLQKMKDAGASNAEMWAAVTQQLKRYEGAMAETEKTGEGMMGALESRWQNVVRAFGEAFADAAKGGMQEAIDKMKEMEEDGTVITWADNLTTAVNTLKDGFYGLGKAIEAAYKYSGLQDLWNLVQGTLGAIGSGIGGFVGALDGGGGIGDAFKEAGKQAADAFTDEMADGFWWKSSRAADRTDPAEAAKKAAADRKAKREEVEAARKAEEEKRVADRLAKAKEEKEKRDADERAKAERKAQEKTLRKELRTNEDAASKMETTATGAKTRFDTELAAFRDAAVRDKRIQEETDRAKAIETMQQQVKSQHLTGQVDSLAKIYREQGEDAFNAEIAARRKRRGIFSADGKGGMTYGFKNAAEEQLVRTAAAFQAGNTAEESLRKIEAHTRDLEKKIDQLLTVK